jgi:CRP/FNR family transcriptional regulator, cyclic AMP receptor protein
MKITSKDLRKVGFFDKYTARQLETVVSMSSIKEFKVKEILFEQYDELSELLILLEGSLALGISISEKKRIHLGTIEEGQLFSWSAVFPPFISTAWVMALTPARVIAIDSKKLICEIEKDCDFGLKTMMEIAHTLSHRLSDTRFQLMNQMML